MPTLSRVVEQLDVAPLAHGTFSVGSNGNSVWRPKRVDPIASLETCPANDDLFWGVVTEIRVIGLPAAFRLQIDVATTAWCHGKLDLTLCELPQNLSATLRSGPDSQLVSDLEGTEERPLSLSGHSVRLEFDRRLTERSVDWLSRDDARVVVVRKNVWRLRDGAGKLLFEF